MHLDTANEGFALAINGQTIFCRGACWTTPDIVSLTASPLLAGFASELAGLTDRDPEAAMWVVRVVLSLLYWPVGDSRFERQMLERFVAPAFAVN